LAPAIVDSRAVIAASVLFVPRAISAFNGLPHSVHRRFQGVATEIDICVKIKGLHSAILP
jgi:hypothetical protein